MCTRSEQEDILLGSSGRALLLALLKAFDTVLLKPMEHFYPIKLAVYQALKALLAVSKTAKTAALEGVTFCCCSFCALCSVLLSSRTYVLCLLYCMRTFCLLGGLIESIVEHEKHLIYRLTMDSMDVVKVMAKKKVFFCMLLFIELVHVHLHFHFIYNEGAVVMKI